MRVSLGLIATGALLGACQLAPGGQRGTPSPPPATPESGPALLGPARQITFVGRRSGEGYFSADGTQLVFQSEREPGNPFYQIYRLDFPSGQVVRVSPGVGKTTCGWFHPGGTRILFASTHADPDAEATQRAELEQRRSGASRRYAWDYDPAYELYLQDVDAEGPVGSPRVLAPARGYDAEGALSPDGGSMVFTSNRHAYDPLYSSSFTDEERQRLERQPEFFADLYLYDLRTRELRRLTETPGYDGGPFFSADGRRIVWRRFSPDGARAEVHTMAVDGSDVRQLTRLDALSWAPFFHPSGEYVIFASSLLGHDNFELFLVDAEGRHEPVRVTESPGFDGLPAFSPDGSTLVWTSQRDALGRSQIFAAPWNDAEARRRLGLPARRDVQARELLPLPMRTRADIDDDDLRAHVEALASNVTEGRLTGTAGARIASGYVARSFRRIGLEPAGDHATFYQEFGFTAGLALGADNRLTVTGPGLASATWQVDVDWRPLAFSKTGPLESAPVVVAGYGLVAPAGAGLPAVDDYAELSVDGRWVAVFRQVPADLPTEAKRHLRRYASLRHKAMIARDRGARGLILLSGPRSQVRRELPELALDASLAGTSLAAVAVTDAVASQLFRAGGHDLLDAQRRFDAGRGEGFELTGVTLSAQIDIEQQRRRGRNVIARIAAPVDDLEAPRPPAIVLGAHLDHLGRGPGPSSLSASDDPDQIHSGADDNASGVAALLEIAELLQHAVASGELELERDLVFAAWSGEELGLLGSQHYVEGLAQELASELPGDAGANPHAGPPSIRPAVAAYLNMDMVGRLSSSLVLFGVESSPVWLELIERIDAPIGLPIEVSAESYLPTDSTSFALRGVPTLSAFTGVHDDYHKPSDTPEKLSIDGAVEVARLLAGIAAELAARTEAPEFVASARPQQLGQRAGLHVYLGTIPDYARSDAQGVRLAGVAEGGPAQKAGLRAGDVIVRVGERRIENIYDYTFALGDLEVGEPVPVVVLRDGRERSLEVVPGSRE